MESSALDLISGALDGVFAGWMSSRTSRLSFLRAQPPHGRCKCLGNVQPAAFAIRLGVSFPRLNEIKRSVTPDTALRLARVLGMSADFWLGLQQDWDLWHAMYSKEVAEIERLVPLQRQA